MDRMASIRAPSSFPTTTVISTFFLLLLLCSEHFLTTVITTSAQNEDNKALQHTRAAVRVDLDAFGAECGISPAVDWEIKEGGAFGCKRKSKHSRAMNNSTTTTEAHLMSRWRMSGGNHARLGDFPSFVQLHMKGRREEDDRYCGGALIDKKWLITSSQCLLDSHESGEARMGFVDVNDVEHMQVRPVQASCKMPDFSVSEDEGIFNDAALVQLSSPFEYNEYVQPACLMLDKMHDDKSQCYTLGMGAINQQGEPSSKVRVIPMKRRPCASFEGDQMMPENEKGRSCYVASVKNIPGNPCRGDAGSPMYCFSKCAGPPQQVVVGMSSFGPPRSCIPGRSFPAGYTDNHKLRKEWMDLINYCSNTRAYSLKMIIR